MNRGRLWPLLAASLLFAAACAAVPPLPTEIPPAREILKKVEERQLALQGLKGLAQVKISSPRGEWTSQQVFLARRPASLRVEALSPLGTPFLYAVTGGSELDLYLVEENRYYRGSFQAGSHFLSLPPDLTAEEIVSFILGSVPLLPPGTDSVRPDRKKGLWILTLRSPLQDEAQDLWVNPESWQIVSAESRSPRFSYRVDFSQFAERQGMLFPHRLALTSAAPRTNITVDFQDVELNPSWEERDFSLPVPRGATVQKFRE